MSDNMNADDKKKMGETSKFRYGIGADILESMQSSDDLPLPNAYRLASVMQEYFIFGKYEEDLIERGMKWRPTHDYWRVHIPKIARFMRQERKLYFVFVRDDGLKGSWRFVEEAEYNQHMKWDYTQLGTRVETYNEKLDDGYQSFNMMVPSISEVPALN